MEVKPIAYVDAGALAMIEGGNAWGNGTVWAGEKPEGYSFDDRKPVYSQTQVDELVQLVETLEERNANLESLRPHWAKGYSSDSIAAQTATSAMMQLWELLGAKHQTEAVSKVRGLKEALSGWKDLAKERARRINELKCEVIDITQKHTAYVNDDQGTRNKLEAAVQTGNQLRAELNKDLEDARIRMKADQQVLNERGELIHQQNAKIQAMALEISRLENSNRELSAYVKADTPYGRYTSVLRPFAEFMLGELKANSRKGDRPGWLAMTADQHLLELYYHAGKLQTALKAGGETIIEHAADVANIAMFIVDVCGGLGVPPAGLRNGSEPELCQDEGCPQYPTDHVCEACDGNSTQKVYTAAATVQCSTLCCKGDSRYAVCQAGHATIYQCIDCAAKWRKANEDAVR